MKIKILDQLLGSVHDPFYFLRANGFSFVPSSISPKLLYQPLDFFILAIHAHQIILQGNKYLSGSRITPPARPSTKLIVNPLSIVMFRRNDIEPSQLNDPLSQHDIDSSACHIRRNRNNAPKLACPAGMLMTGFFNDKRQNGIAHV
jgi:hypothetical protein